VIWVVSLLSVKFIPHGLTPGLNLMAFVVWLGLVSFLPPSPSSALPPRDIFPRLHLNAFRGEPAISEFDWHFTSTHSSSSVFAPTNGSDLHLDIIEASPWPWVAHSVSGRIPATCLSAAPYSDSLSLRLRKSPCLTRPQRFTRRLILQ
jgi:hypothetical protein